MDLRYAPQELFQSVFLPQIWVQIWLEKYSNLDTDLRKCVCYQDTMMWNKILNTQKNQNVSFINCYIHVFQTNILTTALLSLFENGFQSAVSTFQFFFSSYRPELYRCCLCWRDDITLLIGWADMVQVENLVIC